MRTYCHILPGRLRLKLPGLKHSPVRAERLAALVRQLPGVTETAANPTTGSLLVLFDPLRTGHPAIIDFLRERGEIDADLPMGPSRSSNPGHDLHPLSGIAGSVCSVLGKELLKAVLCHALEGTPWSLLLALI